ncbi:hypothetical protein HID58_087233, partial [Brassica napus]
KLDTMKRQLESRAEPSPSIDRRTRPSIDGDYAALRNNLTTRLYILLPELDMIKRQLESRAEPSPSIYRRTRPSIDDDYAALRNKLVTEK